MRVKKVRKAELERRLNRKEYRLLPKQKYCNMKSATWRISSKRSKGYILAKTLSEINYWLAFQEKHGRFWK